MSQVRPLVETLKRELRAQGKTYRDVAAALQLSETSVKRLFAEESFSIKRLESVCALLQLEISDLVQRMEQGIELTSQLSHEQEAELVSDIKLLLIALLLVNKLPFDEIIRVYEISEHEGIRLLARLDRMKIIELQPGNRVKLIVSPNFEWRANGPIQRYFESRVQSEFLNSRFDGPGEYRVFRSGMIPPSANAVLMRKMQALANELVVMNAEAECLPPEQRFGTSLMLAIRPWEIAAFQALRRVGDPREFTSAERKMQDKSP